MTVLRVTDETTKAELEEAMRNLTATLHRMPEHWVDRRAAMHVKIDSLLNEWQAAER